MEIIVVDSDRAALERTAALLRRRCPDARVLPMDDGMEAVQYAYSHIVDAVYTEVLMPRINGFDVARLVRKFHRESRGYVVSRTAAYLDRARWEGLSGCYLKARWHRRLTCCGRRHGVRRTFWRGRTARKEERHAHEEKTETGGEPAAGGGNDGKPVHPVGGGRSLRQFWRVDSRGWTYEIKLTTGTGDNAATDDDVCSAYTDTHPWPGSTSDSKSDDFAEIYCDNKGDDFEKGDTGTYYLNAGIAPWMVSDMELRHGGSDGWTCSKVNVNPRAPQPSANDSRWPKTATLTNWMWSFVNFSSAKDRWLDNSDVISLKGDLITSDGKGNDFKRIINATNFSAANLGLATPIYIGKKTAQ